MVGRYHICNNNDEITRYHSRSSKFLVFIISARYIIIDFEQSHTLALGSLPHLSSYALKHMY